ncbi:MAG: 30S ribosomal protein S17 [Patescibacteria group bacterium]|nr:30S ribosomal protein S17 [Patescibacteria group bacterium]MDD5567482.1 30S ribosomal protein S17 [Patescibacteria group bacterium]
MNQPRSKKRILEGRVVSTKMAKTVVVRVDQTKTHRLYAKRYQISKKYLAHDPDKQCQLGETVQIVETRPISKMKSWKVVKKLTKPKP